VDHNFFAALRLSAAADRSLREEKIRHGGRGRRAKPPSRKESAAADMLCEKKKTYSSDSKIR
jgi:hypothetical protein